MTEQNYIRRKDHLLKLGWALHAAGLLVLCSIVGLTYWGTIAPVKRENHRLYSEAASLQAVLVSRDEVFKQKQQAEELLQDRKIRLEELLARIPGVPDEAEFLAQLTQLSRSTGLTIRQFRPGGSQQSSDYSSVQVELVAEANYESISRFLYGLPKLPRLCEVTNLNIRAESPVANEYPVTISLLIFYAPIQSIPDNVTRTDHGTQSATNS